MATKKQQVRAPENPYQNSVDGADLSPANRLAFDILSSRRDLFPSVGQIMNAGLPEDVAVVALELFRDSLSDPTSAYRRPVAAITAASERAEATGG